MSSKNINKKDNVESSLEQEKKDNKNIIIIVLILIIAVLTALLCYFAFFKEEKLDEQLCSSVAIKEVPTEPKYQYINYQGFKFKMPLDWSFVSSDNKYEVSDSNSKILITFDTIDLDYNTFISEEYQRKYLETLQTSDNIKINNSGAKEKDKNNYYYFEGTNDNYDYNLIAVGDENKTILIGTIFQDKVAYKDLSNTVIDFAISYSK